MKKVLVFGTFDPLHEGHMRLFQRAREAGDFLIVVVARDEAIRAYKGREPHAGEADRLEAVQSAASVDTARLGDKDPQTYRLLSDLEFDVLALGYDQQPNDAQVRKLLQSKGKPHVRVVRLPAWRPDAYKSSYFRK